jgi:acyl-CoA thioester hydrolase
MNAFRFYHSIEIRYGDIDAQRHVNNARYFTFMEQARVEYVRHVGLWDGGDFDGIGFIMAEQSCTYKAQISMLQAIEVGVRTAKIGRKSFELAYSLRDRSTHEELAVGRTVLVAFDYRSNRSIPIPDDWRSTLGSFEGEIDG